MTATDRLNEIEARASAATEGPWVTYRDGIASPAFVNAPSTAVCEIQSDSFVREPDQGDADGSFIAHARTDMPDLVGALRAVLDLHRPGEPYCPTNTAHDLCPCAVTECLDCFNEYPCPTVRAIEEALNA